MNKSEVIRLTHLLGGAVLLFVMSSYAQPAEHPTGGVFDLPSPEIIDPFEDELKETDFKTALGGTPQEILAKLEEKANGGVLPNGTVYPQVKDVDALTTYRNSLERIVALQQRNSGNNKQFPPELFYVLKVKEARHAFHNKPPYAAGSVIWGYDGKYPGPTFKSHHRKPILVRIINELAFDENGNPRPPEIFGGFGRPRISTHLHNGHTGSESDGNPADFYPPSYDPGETLHLPKYPASIKGLRFRDHHYAMFRAGLDPQRGASEAAPNVNDGDVAESISTLWYHDHSLHATAENTYKGLVGVHLVFDEIDSGNENDSNPKALKLPSGKFDIPLLFQDKQFRLVKNGAGEEVAELFLPLENAGFPITSGFLGDVIAVNGQLKPKMEVERRKYRFRLVNAGPSRFYQFFLTKRKDLQSPLVDQSFIQIGNDESLLEKPYAVRKEDGLLLSVSERADVVIDFANYADGDKLFLVNRLIMRKSGDGPKHDFPQRPFTGYHTVKVNGNEDPGDYILRFDVTGNPVSDPSRVPPRLRKSPVLPTVAFQMGTNEPDVSIAATKGQTLVFRHADFGRDHGIRFTDESRVLLKGEDPATKPGVVLKQTDDLGLYGKVVSPGPNGPIEIARFEVIEEIGTPLPFRSVLHSGTGRVERAGGGGPGADLPKITVDAGPGLNWTCGIQDLTPGQLRLLGNRHRVFELANSGGEDGRDWTINGRPFHASPAGSAKIGIGKLDVPRNSLVPGSDDGPDGEVWTIRNTGPWAHPVHIHLEEFQILWRKIIEQPAIITIDAGPNVAWRSGGKASTPAKPLKLAAKMGQTLVFRHADPLRPHGIVFTTPDLVLLKTDAQGSKPNAVFKQTDNFGLYNTDVAGAPNPQELARFEVIQDISTAPAFQCTVHTTDMTGEVSEDKCGNEVVVSGTRPPEYERCKKDVVRLDPGEEVQIFLRFRDFLGKYPIHCHNVLHEDHEMMLRFDVVGDQ
jgi:FtsP/CotA-like multicopper oxidase with cupredoxin domain